MKESEKTSNLCIICCYELNSSASAAASSKETALDEPATVLKFCQQINVNCFNGSSRPPLCPECLSLLASATEKRDEAEEMEGQVRSLQREILKLLRNLQQIMNSYLSEMRVIQDKIKGSDVACLKPIVDGQVKREEKVIGMRIEDCFRLRDGIVTVVKDLSLFQNQRSSKVNCADNNPIDNSTPPTPIKIEREEDDTEKGSEFYDDAIFQEDASEQKLDLKSEDGLVTPEAPRRSARSAAKTAMKRLSKVPKREKKKPKIKREQVAYSVSNSSRIETTFQPSWVTVKTLRYKNSKSLKNRKIYRCELCPEFSSRSPYHVEHHLRQHELDLQKEPKLFSCPHCSSSFALKQLYEYHVTCHGRLFRYVCDICNLYLPPLDLEAHFKESHGDISKIFKCDNCMYCCSSRDTYLEHLKCMHFGSNVMMRCDLCPEIFYGRKEHLEHLHEQHGLFHKLVCGMDGCTKSFMEASILKSHQNVHKNPFTCSECDRKCATAVALAAHKFKHTSSRPFQCTRCPLAFKSEIGLKAHEKIHDRDATDPLPQFQCHLCDRSYKQRRTFDEHIRLHQGLGYTCDQCGYLCARKSGLQIHMESHTERQPKCFCEHCGKGFVTGQHLKRHVRTLHEMTEKDKKYKCSECPKAFHSSYNLKQHLRVHTGEKPFVCDACGKAFNQAGSLWHHRRLIHGLERKSSAKQEKNGLAK